MDDPSYYTDLYDRDEDYLDISEESYDASVEDGSMYPDIKYVDDNRWKINVWTAGVDYSDTYPSITERKIEIYSLVGEQAIQGEPIMIIRESLISERCPIKIAVTQDLFINLFVNRGVPEIEEERRSFVKAIQKLTKQIIRRQERAFQIEDNIEDKISIQKDEKNSPFENLLRAVFGDDLVERLKRSIEAEIEIFYYDEKGQRYGTKSAFKVSEFLARRIVSDGSRPTMKISSMNISELEEKGLLRKAS